MKQSTLSNQVTKSLKKERTSFTGTSIPINYPGEKGTTIKLPNGKTQVIDNIVEWYDKATDWRIAGKSFWHINSLTEEDGLKANIWGKAEIIVDGENPNDKSRGRWELSWYGWISPKDNPPYNENSPFSIVAEAVGIGKEGEVKDLVAKWTYTFDSVVGFYYSTEGFIQKKN